MSPTAIALIGARAGSERVPGKTSARSPATSLLAYAIETARQSDVFDRIVVSTDSEEIAQVARWYGADVPFLRPGQFATVDLAGHRVDRLDAAQLEERYDLFAIVRATNPFRGPDVIRRGLEQLLATPEADSIRAVERVKQHPGKMWARRRGRPPDAAAARPVPPRRRLARRASTRPSAALRPEQRARDRLDARRRATGTREGKMLAPFFTEGYEGFNIDDEDDFAQAERLDRRRHGARPADRPRAEPYPAGPMKLASLETLACDAGWRPWLFVKATTDDGLVGWSEVTDSHGSPTRPRRRRGRPCAARRRPRPARGRGDPLGSLPAHATEPGLDRRRRRSAGSRTPSSTSRQGARRLGRRALRRADAGDRPRSLVALRHDAGARLGGDRDAEARLATTPSLRSGARSSSAATARSRRTSSSRATSRAS